MADPIPELEVLNPINTRIASQRHENSWPEFSLRNATVYDAEGELVSLLEARDDNLLTVMGDLERFRKEKAQFYVSDPPRTRSIAIEIGNVQRFAFGTDKKGGVQLWAVGRAGWYEIEPAREYSETYANMSEAVTFWYFVVDALREDPKVTAEELFTKYAKESSIRPKEAITRFRNHAQFFISNIKKTQEDIKWSSTSIYKLLQEKFPELCQMLSRSPPNRPGQPGRPSKATSSPPSRIEDPHANHLTRSRRLEARREASPETKTRRSQKPIPVQDAERQKSNASILWKSIQRMAKDFDLQQDDLTADALGESVFHDFHFDSPAQAANFIRFHAVRLVKSMQQRRIRTIDWLQTPLYEELLDVQLPPVTKGRMARVEFLPRSSDEKAALGDSTTETSQDDDSPERHHTRSILRPRGSKYLAKGKSYRGKSSPLRSDTDIIDDDASQTSKTSKRKNSSLDLSPRKRQTRARTRTSPRFPSSSTDEDMSTESEEIDEAPQTSALPLRWRKGTEPKRLPSSSPTVVSDCEIGIQPNAPDDVWQCTRNDCIHIVYKASGSLGQSSIQQHIDGHEIEKENTQIDLAMQEMGRTNLPVNNLIQRIRHLAATKEPS